MNKRIWACATVAAALAACGGGGGGSSGGNNNGGGGGNPQPAAVVKISGTAVRGAALANVTVLVKCGAGTGSAVTDAGGKFTVSITDGSLPCVLQAPLPDGGFLHSAVAGTGTGDVAANISPLTELVVASAAGVDPATLFADFANRVAAVTAAALTSGTQQVVTQLAGTIDLAGTNPLTDVLVVGNPLDQKIDALNTALAEAGSDLTDLTRTVVAASPAKPVPPAPTPTTDYDAGTSGTASVAAELVLKPAAPNCASLRSGSYRAVPFDGGTSGFDKVTIDAEKLTVTNADGSVDNLVPVATCRYTMGSGDEVMVTAAGVILFRSKDSTGVTRGGMALPEQAHTLAELQGAWNWIGQQVDPAGGFRVHSGDITFDASGKTTLVNTCPDLKTCTDQTAAVTSKLAVNADGSFDIVNDAGATIGRLIMFTPGGGAPMLVSKYDDGTYAILTRPRANGMPAVGTLGRNWNLSVNSQMQSTGLINESGNLVVTNDVANGVYVRNSYIGTAGATVPETLRVNQPRKGYTTRDANPTNVGSDGSAVNTREFVFLGLRGLGFTPVAFGFNNSMTFSVGVPGVAWVAPEMINRPAATSCVALRSGDYRVVRVDTSASAQDNTGLVTINASALTVTDKSDGSVSALIPGGPCRFTSTDGTEVVVSQAGVAVVRSGQNRLRVAFPEQAHTVAELAGTWNKLALQSPDATQTGYFPDAATVTLDAAGTGTGALYCIDVTTCQNVTGLQIAHTPNASGGFDRVTALGETPDRVFAFRGGSGDLMLVSVDGAGGMGFWTQKRTNSLPTVGARTRNWDVLTGADLFTSIGTSGNVIASADTATNSVVRNRRTANNALYTETVTINNPREGYNHRDGGTTTASDGSTVTIREFTSLSLRGMGFSPLKYVGGPVPSFMLSVNQP